MLESSILDGQWGRFYGQSRGSSSQWKNEGAGWTSLSIQTGAFKGVATPLRHLVHSFSRADDGLATTVLIARRILNLVQSLTRSRNPTSARSQRRSWIVADHVFLVHTQLIGSRTRWRLSDGIVTDVLIVEAGLGCLHIPQARDLIGHGWCHLVDRAGCGPRMTGMVNGGNSDHQQRSTQHSNGPQAERCGIKPSPVRSHRCHG
jgi:hypothetical protein